MTSKPFRDQRDGAPVILVLLFLGGMISYLDRTVMGVLAPMIGRDLALDPAELGLAFSLFYVGYGMCTFLGGWAADRIGARIVLGVSMAFWSVLCGMTGLAGGLAILLVIRFLFGAWEAPWIPASNKLLSQIVRRERFATAFGLTSAGQPIGAALAGPIVAVAAAILGWRVAFLLVALIGLAWVAAWWQLTARISHRPPPSGSPSPVIEQKGKTRLRDTLGQPAIIATCVSFAGANYVQTFFLMWFPSYLAAERHMATVQIGMITTIPWAMATIGMIGGGLLSDYFARLVPRGLVARKWLMAACLLPAAACLLLVPVVASVWTAVALMTVAVGLLFLSGPNYFAAVNQVVPREHLGSALGLLVLCSTLAGTISPIVTGNLVKSTGTYLPAFVVAAAMISLAVAVFVGFARSPAPTVEIESVPEGSVAA